jgi:hypothetical protein
MYEVNLLDYVSGLKVYLYTIRQIGFYKKFWSNFATVESTIDFTFKQRLYIQLMEDCPQPFKSS